MKTKNTVGLYVHIPFCQSRCSYCDFYSTLEKGEVVDKYINELCNEISSIGKMYDNKVIDTLYIGGGTPSVIDTKYIAKILETVEQSFTCRFIEKTIEINPNSHQKIASYARMGFDRISIGIQSTDDSILQKTNRSHNALQGIKALESANRHFKNISCDIILGIDEKQDIAKDLDILLPYVTHLSAYILKVESGTPLYSQLMQKKVSIATDAKVVEQYFIMQEIAKEKGFMPYEISNFALLGAESKHNQKYWDLSDYFGVGAAAHSLIDGKRFYNESDIEKYIAGNHKGNNLEIVEREYSLEDEKAETLMLALRTTAGLNIKEFNKKFNCDFIRDYANKIRLIKDAVTIRKNRFSIKSEYLLVMNTIISGLL